MSPSSPPIDARLFNFNHPTSSSNGSAASTQASRADALSVYSDAVQTPDVECGNLDSLYCDAQAEDTDRPEARVLREDFCSSAMVAHSWLDLHPGNTSQGVDIDLAALERARQTFGGAAAVRLIQSAQYAGAEEAVELSGSSVSTSTAAAIASTTEASKVKNAKGATWEEGAASDRMERRIAKRLAASAKAERRAGGSGSNTPRATQGPRMTLVHSDVLSLPLPPSSRTPTLEAPDLVASLNYALSYFHTRAGLLAYLKMVRATLRPKTGVLITDQFAGPPGADLYPHNQDQLWERFAKEPGFLRAGDPRPSHEDRPLQVYPAPVQTEREKLDSADSRLWPRGRLILVRKGEEAGGFEYWREDGPVDWVTNRFRMSLSFRFADGSWLRDVFSYDFRVWSLKEVTEALEEAGFASIRVSVIPRTATDASDEKARAAVGRSSVEDLHASEETRSRSSSVSSTAESNGTDGEEGLGLDGFASLMKRTEKEESEKLYYQVLKDQEKLFASRSFGTYVAARAP